VVGNDSVGAGGSFAAFGGGALPHPRAIAKTIPPRPSARAVMDRTYFNFPSFFAKNSDDGRVITLAYECANGALRDRRRGEDVVEAPPDVVLAPISSTATM
jgi:hypothetical protein